MTTNIQSKNIDGKAIAQTIRDELKAKIKKQAGERAPGLAVILVGDDPASSFYVNKKQESCAEVGIESFKTVLPNDATKEDVIKVIEGYNSDEKVDGILLQLPLPDAIRKDTQEVVDHIDAAKDVDGLTTENLGMLVTNDKRAVYPCTPKGCMELLSRSNVELSGARVLVIGRSTLVGKPISLMLNQANATVTMAHSRTQDLDTELAQADVVVAAIGVAEFLKGNKLKPGAVVIDVGINSIERDGKKKLVGDVDFASAQGIASQITPVPGGVGPMTVAMLLSNCLELYLRKLA
ncbi:MAG: bifunctional methylenetetrahydrofolate dehydrogenase/methenyltetrahydrofolate cyclohydrolase FolD [Candidatus Melainabacteria bacterium]|nr:bifunctional methylenetetrahydrofolate dehydrogenase/methenyltetrahydrofolate cyclohydrolase FolD [Candidatus Melainabacteria bacterium]